MAAKKKTKRKTLFEQLWTEADPLRKIMTATISTVVLVGTAIVAWGNIDKFREDWYVSKYGRRPHASITEMKEIKQEVEQLVQWTAGELVARQVQRQTQIGELRAKCNAGRCTVYDRQSLQNLEEAWYREQQFLDRIRQQQQQQPQQRPYQYPYSAQR